MNFGIEQSLRPIAIELRIEYVKDTVRESSIEQLDYI